MDFGRQNFYCYWVGPLASKLDECDLDFKQNINQNYSTFLLAVFFTYR